MCTFDIRVFFIILSLVVVNKLSKIIFAGIGLERLWDDLMTNCSHPINRLSLSIFAKLQSCKFAKLQSCKVFAKLQSCKEAVLQL